MRRWLLLLVPFALSLPSIADDTVAQIVSKFEQVQAMKLPQRPDFTIYDPFVRAEPIVKGRVAVRRKPRNTSLRLEAVLNDRAFINGRWMRAGMRLGGWRIVSIRPEGVTLRQGGRRLLLPLVSRKRLLKIKDSDR